MEAVMPGVLLTDAEIMKAIALSELVLEQANDGGGTSPFHAERCVQPSSIDLSIGRVFLPPPSEIPEPMAEPHGETGFILQPGHTVLVETEQKITLSTTIAAFGFPPSRLAKNSILMTNPGHVDPGFSGFLKFTLINMGRNPFSICKGSTVVSLLVFRFDAPVKKAFFAANPKFKEGDIVAPLLNMLAPDFARFTDRMRDAAEKAVEKQLENIRKETADAKQSYTSAAAAADNRKFVIPVVAALIAAVVAAIGNYISTSSQQRFAPAIDLITVRERVARIESAGDIDQLRENVEKIGAEMKRIETSCRTGPRP
jgi:deoxycytidine triphosphate deaminase